MMTVSLFLSAGFAASLLALVWRGLVSPGGFARALGGLALGSTWVRMMMEAGHG